MLDQPFKNRSLSPIVPCFGLVDIEHPGFQDMLMYHLTDGTEKDCILGVEIVTARHKAKEHAGGP